MFAAGGILWLNVTPCAAPGPYDLGLFRNLGFPLAFYSEQIEPCAGPQTLWWGLLLVDVAIALSILLLVALASEWWVRRPEPCFHFSRCSVGDVVALLARPPSFWRQVHLSTCVLLMFASGSLIWINLHPRVLKSAYIVAWGDWKGWTEGPLVRYLGWPSFFSEQSIKPEGPVIVHWWSLVFDVAVGLALLFLVWFLCEWWIWRRREARGR
jgi:hypothetical protein